MEVRLEDLGVDDRSALEKGCFHALGEIHSQGVYHQDICADNVLWDPMNKKPTIIDLNMACFSDEA